VLGWGDYATLSFHATKAFNTFEGGAIVTRADGDRDAIERQRNFGIENEVSIPVVGTNAKMSEFNAAVGLVQMDHFEKVVAAPAARSISATGRCWRTWTASSRSPFPRTWSRTTATFPLLVREGFPVSRDALYERLKAADIYSRRYFFPLLSNLPMYRDLPSAAPERLPSRNRAADQVLCLPIHPELSHAQQDRVLDAVRAAAASA
jgi:dTDP-4-amino-4,6-dideoxygalactose transaminase